MQLTNADLVKHELSEWQSLASAASADLYANVNGQLPPSELGPVGATSTIRQLRLGGFGSLEKPRPLELGCFHYR